MAKTRISLLHPFSAKAIGLKEADLYYSHSKPQERALLKMQERGYLVCIEYFTGHFIPYYKTINGMRKKFWPITKPLFKKRHTWRRQYSWIHYLHNLVNPADLTIINMSGHGSKYCFKLAQLLRKKGKSYITMIGGIHLSADGPAKEYFQNAHHIIVHTQLQKNQMLQQETFKNLDIQVMPLGIDEQEFLPKQRDTDDIELLFVGRLTRLKQIELCIEAVAYLIKNQKKKVNLTIIGPVSDALYFSELKSLAVKLKVLENINFEGLIEQKKLVPFYQKADLLLLPSSHESFGMVMVEAMACGTPVAALIGSGGPDEIVKDGVNGILTTKVNFSERIFNYVQSKEMESKFKTNSRKQVVEKWSLKQTEQSMQNSINKVFKDQN